MLSIDITQTLQLDIQSFVGRSVAVLGITGSGKTNTAAVLIEELLTSGLPLTIVDIEGEYWGLKEKYELLVAGRSEHAELAIGPENAAQLAEVSVQRGISVILDLSDYTQDEQYDFLVEYFKRLWEVCSKAKSPYQIILEESHEFIPQGATTPLKQLLTRIALRGRKRGLGIILMSQRSAKVEKDVLTQASLLFLHKVVHPIDMKVYKDLIPLPVSEVEHIVGALHPGQVVVISNHQPTVAQIRLRHTFHAGATPEFGSVAQPELRRVDESLLKELQQLLTATKDAPKHERRHEKRIEELETLLAERDAEIAHLKEQVDLLGRLSVAVETNGSLPTALAIEEAVIQEMHVPDRVQSVPIVESTLSAPQIGEKSDVLVPINEKKLTSLRRRLNKVPKIQRAILSLVQERGKALNVYEIAAWLNLTESYVRNNPPHDLMRMGLLDRYRAYDRSYYYESTVKAFVAREFPGADVDAVVRRLWE